VSTLSARWKGAQLKKQWPHYFGCHLQKYASKFELIFVLAKVLVMLAKHFGILKFF
jgi:hypothetical protein